MRIPAQVTAAAFNAETHSISPVAAAVNLELCDETVTPSSLHTIAAACSQGWELPEFGGQDGATWAAYQATRLGYRDNPIADWVVATIAGRGMVDVTAAAGDVKPRVLARWDEQINTELVRFHSQLHQMLIDEIHRVARTAGSRVMAWAKDPTVRQPLIAADLVDVVTAAAAMTLKPGRTAWTAAAVDLPDLVERGMVNVKKRSNEIVEETKQSIRESTGTLFGVAVLEAPVDWAAITAGVVGAFRSISVGLATKSPPRQAHGIITRVIDSATVAGETVSGAILKSVVSRIPDGAPAAAVNIRDAAVLNRLAVRVRIVWVHQAHGFSPQPFPPHKALNGVDVGTPEWYAAAETPMENTKKDGSVTVTAPFAPSGRWSPGDHDGCKCDYRVDTVLTGV